jgi:hypothetical protein
MHGALCDLARSAGHRARSNVYVMPSGRLVVTRNNAKSIRSMRAMFITLWYIAPGVSGAPAAMTTCRSW